MDTLLNDLELYADPRQGLGSWLLPDEYVLANDLAERLHSMAGPVPPRDAGKAVLEHSDWPQARDAARRLLNAIGINGPKARIIHEM